jgi:hypothetical protein
MAKNLETGSIFGYARLFSSALSMVSRLSKNPMDFTVTETTLIFASLADAIDLFPNTDFPVDGIWTTSGGFTTTLHQSALAPQTLPPPLARPRRRNPPDASACSMISDTRSGVPAASLREVSLKFAASLSAHDSHHFLPKFVILVDIDFIHPFISEPAWRFDHLNRGVSRPIQGQPGM